MLLIYPLIWICPIHHLVFVKAMDRENLTDYCYTSQDPELVAEDVVDNGAADFDSAIGSQSAGDDVRYIYSVYPVFLLCSFQYFLLH